MSITTYTELQQAIADWLERADLTARIPDFIALFEATANRRLRLRQPEAVAILTPTSGVAALPADFLGARRVTWTGPSRVELEYVQPSYLQAAYPAAPAGVPRVYTIEGATLRMRPVDGTALELDYLFNIQLVGDAVIEINPRISTVVYQENLNLPYLGIKHALGELSESELASYADLARPTRRALRYFDQVECDSA